MISCCGCCSALRPRYKRLVDNIFPSNPQDGLVKSNMEKLTFYALSSPEKLDRIGDYLARKVARDLSRHRNGYTMDAMDQLLVACHAQTLNLFVESFLKIVQQLLESHEPDMQLLATQSFVKFANIEEDTPSYHRRYDFFVSKFSSLCHNGNSNLEVRNMLRTAGLNGLKGVIRKTVSDDLQADIWEEQHMDKIVPSLLFNMQCQDVLCMTTGSVTDGSSQSAPAAASSVAEQCLRDLIGRAAFGHVHSVVKPVIKHLDNHQLWQARQPNEFAVQSFKVIMYSIQAQHSYAVIQMLMSHLDDVSRSQDIPLDAQIRVRTGIVNVLSNIVSISASESIGPSVLEMINSLLHHLRASISNIQDVRHVDDEKQFQETVINTLGEFANNLPDYQKIEIMIFIMSKAPPTVTAATDIQLQNIILKSLLKVTTKYRTVHMSQAFPTSFLNPLLSRSLASDPKVRLTVQQIFHQLLDRHNNLPKLSRPVSLSSPDQLTIEKADRRDLMFMKKHGTELLFHIYENVQLSNNTDNNFDAIYATLALLCVELNSEETLAELLRLTFAIQDLAAAKGSTLADRHKSSIHCLVAGFLHLVGHLVAIPAYCTHVETVIKCRTEKTPWFLPERNAENKQNKSARRDVIDAKLHASPPDDLWDELMFNKAVITEALQSSGHDISALLTPFMPRNMVDSSMTRSISDLNTITVEVDSVNSSPGLPRRQPEEEITFESLRKIINEPISAKQDEQEIRRLQIVDRFKNASFHDLIARYERKSNDLQHKLLEALTKYSALQTIDANKAVAPDVEVVGDEQFMDCVDSVAIGAGGDDGGQALTGDKDWHFYENPLKELCAESEVNGVGPPLFALKFPELFVY
ncbi:unnamed protein product [Medioppia subpectinata]|uniref:EFR3-like protein n=1 Tax=Medioppia subpectinata TaxID=1979941 RepID=A0A7R9PX63_9ACAR|nr:unnamed protein product [Medioppia subpectinata]CAG2104067.1 unnamed protein product [Medioppia subpectinata]